jgi:hypothetical protein
MNKWLKVVALVMLTLVSAVGLRNALGSNHGSSVMVAKDGGMPVPVPEPW